MLLLAWYCQSRCRSNDYVYYPTEYAINDKTLIKPTNTKIQDTRYYLTIFWS